MSDLQARLAEIRRQKTCDLRQGALVTDAFLSIPPHRVGILHLAIQKRLLLADPTGCGKTPQALVAYAYLKEKDPTLRCLVVTIKGALFQWQASVDRFLRNVQVMVPGYSRQRSKQDPDVRRAQWASHASDIFVTTYQTLARDAELLLPVLDNYVLILDEVQTVGNAQQGALFPAAQKLSLKAHYCWGLSATPLMKRLENLYAIFEVIWPGLLGGSLTAFRGTYLDEVRIVPKGGGRPFWKVTGHKHLDQLKQIIEPYRLARPAEEIDQHLPPVVLKQIVLTMSPKQRALYDQIVKKVMPLAKVEEKNGSAKLAKLIKPHANTRDLKSSAIDAPSNVKGESVENTPDFDQAVDVLLANLHTFGGEGQVKRLSQFASVTYAQMAADAPAVLGFAEIPSVKGQELVRFLTEECSNGEKVIVYSKFEKVVTWICETLQGAGVSYARITGKESAKTREEARQRFQTTDKTQVMVITDAGGQALDLQAAGIVVFFDLPWVWGSFLQTIGRARRVGSVHQKVLAVVLTVEHSIDEKVVQLLNETEHLVAQLFGSSSASDPKIIPKPKAASPDASPIPMTDVPTIPITEGKETEERKSSASALFLSVLSDLPDSVPAELKIPIP